MNRKIVAGLILAVVFQCCVLTGMVVSASMPLWTGTQIKIKTVPVDPRSMFRGDYARLGYEFSRLNKTLEKDLSQYRTGEVVYVTFKPGKDDVYRFDTVVTQKPDTGVFIRGRLETQYGSARIKCGIEAFFAPGEKALALEKQLRNSAVAVLMVSGSGRARLKDVIGKE